MIRAIAALLLLFVGTARAEPCRSEEFEGNSYIVCSFDLAKDELRMFWRDADNAPYRTFSALKAKLAAEGRGLAFAMNGGMYDENLRPIGLYIEGGRELTPANTKSVSSKPEPNFYKKPNGVFYVDGEEAGVMTTDLFLNVRPETAYATQSGPMLVIDGAIHPAFIPGSTDRKPRSGVGLSDSSHVHFAITDGILNPVNFHDFARFFRDRLGCRNALFLDGGSAPGLFAPELGREDAPGHGGYGAIIGVVTAKP